MFQVYEQCKDDPFLAKFDVDFSVCLHAHYPCEKTNMENKQPLSKHLKGQL